MNTDIPFLGWVMYTASRSHLEECPWSVLFGEPENRTRVLLERISRTSLLPWSYIRNFRIAEVNGRPVAAMCGYAPGDTDYTVIEDLELNIATQEFKYSRQRQAEIRDRFVIAASGFPDDLPGSWGVENVAVLPEFYSQGLVDSLFESVLQEGVRNGFKTAQIMSLIGNEKGLKAFERNGFSQASHKTSPEFEKLFGTPGVIMMTQAL